MAVCRVPEPAVGDSGGIRRRRRAAARGPSSSPSRRPRPAARSSGGPTSPDGLGDGVARLPGGGAAKEPTARKEQVLTQRTASIVHSISDAVVAKDGEPFFLCPPDGQVLCQPGHGYGLYHHDCRFLSGYEMRIAGATPSSLAASEAEGTRILLELTNPDLLLNNGRLIAKEDLGITWSRRVDGARARG